jgi:hypothetical protein
MKVNFEASFETARVRTKVPCMGVLSIVQTEVKNIVCVSLAKSFAVPQTSLLPRNRVVLKKKATCGRNRVSQKIGFLKSPMKGPEIRRRPTFDTLL